MARDLHAIADRVERDARAPAVLAEGGPFARTALPTVMLAWLLLGLSPIPAALIELRHVRRRLDAALVLLDLAQGER